jgi:hypothetical protein
MAERFDVCTPRPKGDGTGTWWHKVGTAWRSDKGLITVYLDSVPVPDPEKGNKIVMMLFEPKQKGETRAAQQTKQERVDDEIPF